MSEKSCPFCSKTNPQEAKFCVECGHSFGIVCYSCNTVNPEAAHFCMECRSPLGVFCEECGSPNPLNANFCVRCGHGLSEEARSMAPALEARLASPKLKAVPDSSQLYEKAFLKPQTFTEATEKQNIKADDEFKKTDRLQIATIVFVDIKGFTALSEKLKPDQVKYIMDHILKSLTDCIESEKGYIDKYIGDAILAVFGIPRPFFDDSSRAIESALKMQSKIAEIAKSLRESSGIEVQIRVGINTGKVILGSVGKGRAQDFTVLGDPVNLAQRLESNCKPGEVLVSETTYNLTKNDFSFRKLKPFKVKGKQKPIQAYEVEDRIKFDFTIRKPEFDDREIEFTGREKEKKQIENEIKIVCKDHVSRSFLLVGEQGVGKSALALEVKESFSKHYGQSYFFISKPNLSALGISDSILEGLIRNQFQILEGDDPAKAFKKLTIGLGSLLGLKSINGSKGNNEKRNEIAEKLLLEGEVFFSKLLGIGQDDHPLLKGYSASDGSIAKRILIYFHEFLKFLSDSSPVLILIEDAHHLSEQNMDMLSDLSILFNDHPICILFMARNEISEKFKEKFKTKKQLKLIELGNLDNEESGRLVHKIFSPIKKAEKFPWDSIIEKSGGNPLFMFEICQLLLEQKLVEKKNEQYIFNAREMEKLEIPNSVQLVLQNRMNHLSEEAMKLLQRASIIGESFWQKILLMHTPDHTALNELLEKKLILSGSVSQIPGDKEYVFASKVIREICYESIPETEKRESHGEIAEWMSEFSDYHTIEMSINMAYHRKAAGMIRESFNSLVKAANHAYGKGDFITAARAYKEADSIRMVNEIFGVFDKKEQRIEEIEFRFPYLLNYINSIKLGLGDLNMLSELCYRYIKILEESQRKPADESKDFQINKQSYLRYLWSEIIASKFDSIEEEKHKEIANILGNFEEDEIPYEQVLLWFQLNTLYCQGINGTSIYEKQILNLIENSAKFAKHKSFKDPMTRFYLYNGISKYYLFLKHDMDEARINAAKAAEIAVANSLNPKSQLNGLTILAYTLAESGEFRLAAQIFRYEYELQKKIGTKFELFVYLSNEAECLLRLGNIRCASNLYLEVIDILRSKGVETANQCDAFIHYAILHLNHKPDPKVDEMLSETEDVAKKSPTMQHRWNRAKAFCSWINHKDLKSALKHIEKALETWSKSPIETIMTEMIRLQILKAASSNDYDSEFKRIEKFAKETKGAEIFWKNFLETGTIYPKIKAKSEDQRPPILNSAELAEKIHSYC